MIRLGRAWARVLLAISLLAGVWHTHAWAHPPVGAVANIRVGYEHDLTIELSHDVLAFALNDASVNIPDGPMFELLHSPDDVLGKALADSVSRFKTLCVLTVDGERVPVEVTSSPTLAAVRAEQKARGSYPLPIKLELYAHAQLAPTAKSFRIRLPEMLGEVIVSVERPDQEISALPLKPNETSPDFDIPQQSSENSDGTPQPRSPSDGASTWTILIRFTSLGFTHIIPDGADHCLFVLGLFLMSPKLKPVLVQISAFTVAHTLTLTLTSQHIIGMPSSIVEPAIAASIAFVGIENLLAKKVDYKRTIIAFMFGLVHGMGVATAFNEAKFPPGMLLESLAAFTVGVEAGHISVLLAAFAALTWCAERPWYRTRVAFPLSLLISVIAMFWFVQRVLPQG